MTLIEDFFREIDALWTGKESNPIPLRLIGSTALFLQAEYQRGTKDSDVLETAAPALHRHRCRGLALPSGYTNLEPHHCALSNFSIFALDITDVVVSKLKRFDANDTADIHAMVNLELIANELLVARFRCAVDAYSMDSRASDLPRYVDNLHEVERDMLGTPESEIALPSWV